jgi:hypothetical protein
MRANAAAVSLLLFAACNARDVQLPRVQGQTSPEPCQMPAPPPALVSTTGADPAHCLPQGVRARGLDVQVLVSAEGRAVAVEDAFDLCLVVGLDGKVIPKHTLGADEKQCVLGALRDWRFTTVTTCWPVSTHVRLGGRRGRDAQAAGEYRGGPTSACT